MTTTDKFLTPEDVVEMRERMDAMVDDPEAAHVAEDDMYYAVLWHIAEGKCISPADCAKEALISKETKFPRWCA